MKTVKFPLLIAATSMLLATVSYGSTDTDQVGNLSETTFHTQQVGEVEVFYREAGAKDAPALLLLHGFPSSSHQFRELIPLLADDYRVIAPDFPGFGKTVAPPRGEYDYTFDNLSASVEGLIEALDLEKFSLYVFDYGAPVGFRIAEAHPEKITAIISQNGNVYEEGLSPGFDSAKAYWKNDTEENRNALRRLLKAETTTWQFTAGVPEDRLALVSKESIEHAQANLDRDGELQLDLLKDYGTNVAAYPQWQEYLRENQPPLLAIWGKNDPFFIPPGAEAFKRDLPNVIVEYLDTGHWALETHAREISTRTKTFLNAL